MSTKANRTTSRMMMWAALSVTIALAMGIVVPTGTARADFEPGPFPKSSPAQNAVDVAFNNVVSFYWESAVGAGGDYFVCVTSAGTCTSTDWIGPTGDNSYNLAAGTLDPSTSYYWQVKAVNDYGTTYADGSETAGWWFTTGDQPGAFHKLTPLDDATVPTNPPTLTWEASAGADYYMVCIDDEATDPCNIGFEYYYPVTNSVELDSYILSPESTYFWQVQAYSEVASAVAGEEVWSFSTGSVPGSFSWLTPEMWVTGQPLSVTLTWQSSSGADEYWYCYSVTLGCDPNVDGTSTTSTSAEITGLTPGALYYWTVWAYNTWGGTGPSNTFSYGQFTVNAPPYDLDLYPLPVGIYEGDPAGTTIGMISAGDPDMGDSLTFSLDKNGAECPGPNNDLVYVEASTLKSSVLFDYENQPSIEICLKVTDIVGSAYFEAFTIPVWDKDELESELLSTGAKDGWILEKSRTSSTGGTLDAGAGTFNLGDDALKRQYRAVLSFNAIGLEPGSIVTSITLKIKKSVLVGANPFKSMGGIQVDLRGGALGTKQALQLGDWQAAPDHDDLVSIANAPVSNWYSVRIPVDYADHVDRTGVVQIRLHFTKGDNGNAKADLIRFFSGNASNWANRPRLIITYIPIY